MVIPYVRHALPNREDFDHFVDQIWTSGIVANSGMLSRNFEAQIKKDFHISNLLLTSNGTFAIELGLRLLAQANRRARYVVTTPFTYIATVSAIKSAGLIPIFVDIEPEYLTLDPDLVLDKLVEENISLDEVLAIIPVHVFNNCARLEAFSELSESTGIPILYDAAHAFGCEYQDRSVLEYGTLSAVSLHASKALSTGEGGLLASSRSKLIEMCRIMVHFGLTESGTFEADGTNGKISELTAAFGNASLIDFWNRRQLRSRYADRLSEACNGQTLSTIPIREGYVPNHNYFPVLVDSAHSLSLFCKRLDKEEIGFRRYFNPTLNTIFKDRFTYDVSESVSSRIVCLPMRHNLSEGEIEEIIDVLSSFS